MFDKTSYYFSSLIHTDRSFVEMDTARAHLVEEIVDFLIRSVVAAKALELSDDGGKTKLREWVLDRVSQDRPLKMVLPAFPGKTPNLDKVMGTMPDYAEYASIVSLAEACQRLSEMYLPGAQVTLFSDYHTFQDYVGIKLDNHYNYRCELEAMVRNVGAQRYITIRSLKDFPEFEGLPEAAYMHRLREVFGNRDFEAELASSERFGKKMESDNKFKHDLAGLRGFMLKDQGPVLQQRGLTGKAADKEALAMAKGMMIQGKALTKFTEKYYPLPEYLRLSIHAHPFDGKKFTVLLLPCEVPSAPRGRVRSTSALICTPWHVSACFDADVGRPRYAQRAEFGENSLVVTHSPNSNDGCVQQQRPWLLLKVHVKGKLATSADWRAELQRPGFGLVLTWQGASEPPSITDFSPKEISTLRKQFGFVLLRHAAAPQTREELAESLVPFGQPVPWNFGIVHAVRPMPNAGTVQSTKRLTHHFDLMYPPPYMGVRQNLVAFGVKPCDWEELGETTTHTYNDYIPPMFCLFCKTAPPPGQGQTTIVDGRLVLQLLPPNLSRDLRRTVLRHRVAGDGYYGGAQYFYPVVMKCPETGRDMFRYGEQDPASGKRIEYYEKPDDLTLSVQELNEVLVAAMQDSRASCSCDYENGDFVFIDNNATLHGRKPFAKGWPRELWRIQFMSPDANPPPFAQRYHTSCRVAKCSQADDFECAFELLVGLRAKGLAGSVDAFQQALACAVRKGGKVVDVVGLLRELSLQGVPIASRIPRYAAVLQNVVPAEAQGSYSEVCLALLQDADSSKCESSEDVNALWAATARAAGLGGMAHVLCQCDPLKHPQVPRSSSLVTALMMAHGNLGSMEQVQRWWAEMFRDGDINKAIDQRAVCAYGEAALKNGQFGIAQQAVLIHFKGPSLGEGSDVHEACTRLAEAFAQFVCAAADCSFVHPAALKKLVPYMDATSKQALRKHVLAAGDFEMLRMLERCGVHGENLSAILPSNPMFSGPQDGVLHKYLSCPR